MLQELGSSNSFNCSELDMVLAEVGKVEQWKQRCKDIAGSSVGDMNSLSGTLLEVCLALFIDLYYCPLEQSIEG